MQPHPKTANGCSKDISSYPTHLEKRITRRRLEKDQHVSFLYRWLEMWSGIGQMGGGSLLRKGMLMMLSRSDGLRGASVRDVKLANGNTLASYCAYEL
jgi:hypothetical protein